MDSVITVPIAIAIGALALIAGLLLHRFLRAVYRLAERYMLPARYVAYRGKRIRTPVRDDAVDGLADT